MKRFLSIFLAVTMILAMLPTAFAAVDEATGAVTYEFSADSHEGTSNKLETYKGVLNESCKEYPENPADPGVMWAYLGTNVPYATTSNYFALINRNGESYVLTGLLSYDGWIAFKVLVPATGIYDISGTAWGRTDTSENQEMYLIPADATLTGGKSAEETFARPQDGGIYGTVALDEEASKYVRTGATTFSELGIDSSYLVSISNTKGTKTAAKVDMETAHGVELESGEYILVLRQANSSAEDASNRLSIASLTLTPAKLDKTHNYVFNNTVLIGDILNNTAFTEYYRVFYEPEGETYATASRLDAYDHINSSESNSWAISPFSGTVNKSTKRFSSSLKNEYLQMVGRKDLNQTVNADARFVLKLKVDYPGIYKITADVVKHERGMTADIYVIPASGETTEISLETLKNYSIIGSVSNVSEQIDSEIGAVEIPSAGDYYMVFAFNSQNPDTNNNLQYFNLSKLTFTEIDVLPESGATPEDVEEGNVPKLSFSATTNIPEKAKVTINGVEGNLAVINPTRGKGISVSAPEVPGYKFIGWKSGAATDTGDGELSNTAKFVKDLKQDDSFTVYTSTFLTAVYEETEPAESTASVVGFWNLDGSYLGQKTVDKIKEEGGLPTTSLIGHTFTGWFTAENVALDIELIVEKVTHAVAGYTTNETLVAANKDAVRVNGESKSEVKYGTEVECLDPEPSRVTHWLRDGKVVSYDETYKYYVWDSTNITSSYAPIEEKPLVVLDGETVSGAYMIEYDKGNADAIVEVGILFGTGTPTVESKSEIFKSQRGDDHGQFAAKPTDSSYTARGYMIYEENGSYKVIYSE